MFRHYEKTFRVQVPQFTVPGKHYLASNDVKLLLAGQVTIEEKLDGANTCVVKHKDQIHLQRKGGLVGQSEHLQFQFFWHWAMRLKYDNLMAIPSGYWVYGELMRCVHSVYYERLPDWFIVFDVWNKKRDQYLTRKEIEDFCQEYSLTPTPLIDEGHFNLQELYELIPEKSAFGDLAEGIVIKKRTKKAYMRGKIVKPEFMKMIGDEHWRHKKARFNKVVSSS